MLPIPKKPKTTTGDTSPMDTSSGPSENKTDDGNQPLLWYKFSGKGVSQAPFASIPLYNFLEWIISNQKRSCSVGDFVVLDKGGKNLGPLDLLVANSPDEPYEVILIPDKAEERRDMFLNKLQFHVKDRDLPKLLGYVKSNSEVGKDYPTTSFADILRSLEMIILFQEAEKQNPSSKKVLTKDTIESELIPYLMGELRILDFNFDNVKRRFVAKEDHSFKAEIDACRIPAKVDEKDKGTNLPVPDLLRYGLDEAADSQKIRLTQKILEPLKKEGYPWLENALSSESEAIAFIGVSGCGKTRTIYEYLSDYYGVLLVWDKKGNGGADDKEIFLGYLLDILKPGFNDGNQAVVNHAFKLLLIGRLMILDLLVKSAKQRNERLAPHDWLLMQLYPKHTFSKKVDVFAKLFGKLVTEYSISLPAADALLDSYTATIWAENEKVGDHPKILCFHDEAQQMLEHFNNGYFFFNSISNNANPHQYSLLDAVTRCRITTITQILSGTALRLSKAAQLSAIGKRSRESWVYSEFGTQDKASLVSYFKLFSSSLQLEEEFREVAPWLIGRNRFVSLLMTEYLQGKSMNEAMKTLEKRLVGLTSDPVSLSFQWRILAESQDSKLFVNGCALVRAYLVDDDTSLEQGDVALMENGVAVLIWWKEGNPRSVIVEPLSVLAWSKADYRGTHAESIIASMDLTKLRALQNSANGAQCEGCSSRGPGTGSSLK